MQQVMSPGISPGADVGRLPAKRLGRHPSARFAGSRLAVKPMTVWLLQCLLRGARLSSFV